MHEDSLHDESCFVTLTYRTEDLPPGLSLRYSDFQVFMRALRASVRPRKVRFFCGGEYGEKDSRPHFHVLLFGYRPDDLVRVGSGSLGDALFDSASLARLWGKGFVSVGRVSYKSAGYVARYVMKKQLGPEAGPMREILDVETGEIHLREHEMMHCSLRPGIGSKWFEKFSSDVFPHDFVVVSGSKVPVPRYYWKLQTRVDVQVVEDEVALRRYVKGRQVAADNTDERLRVRERVAKSRVGLLRRS